MVVIRASSLKACKGDSSATYICESVLMKMEGLVKPRKLYLASEIGAPSRLHVFTLSCAITLHGLLNTLVEVGAGYLVDHFELNRASLGTLLCIMGGGGKNNDWSNNNDWYGGYLGGGGGGKNRGGGKNNPWKGGESFGPYGTAPSAHPAAFNPSQGHGHAPQDPSAQLCSNILTLADHCKKKKTVRYSSMLLRTRCRLPWVVHRLPADWSTP